MAAAPVALADEHPLDLRDAGLERAQPAASDGDAALVDDQPRSAVVGEGALAGEGALGRLKRQPETVLDQREILAKEGTRRCSVGRLGPDLDVPDNALRGAVIASWPPDDGLTLPLHASTRGPLARACEHVRQVLSTRALSSPGRASTSVPRSFSSTLALINMLRMPPGSTSSV